MLVGSAEGNAAEVELVVTAREVVAALAATARAAEAEPAAAA